jgi:hypothetical protein
MNVEIGAEAAQLPLQWMALCTQAGLMREDELARFKALDNKVI